MTEEKQQDRPFEGFGDTSNYDGGLQDNSLYPATVVSLMTRYIDKGQWPGDKVVWKFQIGSETLEALTSTATGPESRAGDWLVSLLGKERYDRRGEQRITMDELAGKPCQVHIQFSDKGWPRIAAVLPAPARSVPAPVAAPTLAAAPTQRRPSQQDENFDDLPF